jgi:hypothetical protein
MSREIIIRSYCDLCRTQDPPDIIDAVGVEVVQLGRGPLTQLDLCELHLKGLRSSMAEIISAGVPADEQQEQQLPPPGKALCPICGAARASMAGHLRSVHGTSRTEMARAAQGETERPLEGGLPLVACPICGKSFKGPQGVGLHTRRIHHEAAGSSAIIGPPGREAARAAAS